jgi:ABC-2 type transport system ATP-binding protein
VDVALAADAIRRVPGVGAVEPRHDELIVSVEVGAATIGPVAVALADTTVTLRDLTLRTPTLDDVYLQLTGNRIGTDESSMFERTTDASQPGAGQSAAGARPEPQEALR